MELLVGGLQPFAVYVGVDLSGANIGVTEELLDFSESRASGEEVRREAMAERVWRWIRNDAGLCSMLLHHLANRYDREPEFFARRHGIAGLVEIANEQRQLDTLACVP